MEKENKLFVIIVTYRGQQWYERCFESLRQSELPIHIVVVDNASCDGTVEYIRAHYPEVHLIEQTQNLGFGKANNIGICYAMEQGCDYVFLLNQDTWIEPNTLGELVRIHQTHKEYGLLSPIHLAADKRHIEKGVLNYISDYRTTDKCMVEDMYFGRLGEVYDTQYINAAAWLLPRKTLETVGGFDPIYFHYAEDDDYLHRVRYHGWKIGICPQLRIVHDAVRPHRTTTPAQQRQRHRQQLLTQYTDINEPDRLADGILYRLRKFVTKLLRAKPQIAKQMWLDACYLFKSRKRIELSRKTNQLRQASWL